MKSAYPNLELLEYQTLQYLSRNDEVAEKRNKLRDEYAKQHRTFFAVDLECQVFLQTWSATCTAFDITPDGSPAIAGSAITDAYTTVFYDRVTNSYVVFIDNRMCYMVCDPNDTFLDDLNDKALKPLSRASKEY